jgi:hypothetical protein
VNVMKRSPKIALALALTSATFCISPAVEASEAARSPVLVELFTAEGCSSCPPADEFLLQLDAAQPVQGAQLIVLSEHMNYWNDSWPDPFSSAQLTARQADYARAFNIRSPYTPQIVIDGASELHLNLREQVDQIFRAAAIAQKIPVTIGSLSVKSAVLPTLVGRVEVDGKNALRKADVYVAIALDRLETHVLRGENRGRTLTHVAVVQYLSKIGSLSPGRPFGQDFEIPMRHEIDPNNARVIAFVQESGNGKVVGATLQHAAAAGAPSGTHSS